MTSAGWQVTLCDPMWRVLSRSGVATLRTAIHLLLTYWMISDRDGTSAHDAISSAMKLEVVKMKSSES